VLCHLEGLTNEQAAGRLGLPVRTVQRRPSEGRERPRHRLTRLGLAPAFSPIVEAAPVRWIEATGLAAGRAVGAVASAPVAALVKGTMAAMLVARVKAVAAGVFIAASLATPGGVGAQFAARPRVGPPAPQTGGDRSAPPPVVQLGPWIKGIVVDETGRPVAGARVSSLWAFQPKSVTTKGDGTFALPTDEPRLANQSILATADAGARQGVFRFDGPSGYKGPRTLARVVLRPAQDVTVTVVDKSGAPVPDAAVFVLDMAFPVAGGRTDARGIAVLRAPADAWVQWIVCAKPDVGFDYFENYRSAPPVHWNPPPRSARLVLDGARTVRIRTVDSAGRPVPGFEFYPQTIWKTGKLWQINPSPLPIDPRTDANGVATFDWLPADLRGGPNFDPASTTYDLPDPPALDLNQPDVELTARVLRRMRVSGRVTRPDGSPAPGIRVEAHFFGGIRIQGGSVRTWTAADGTYAMDVPPDQTYMIGVIDDEWAAPSLGDIVAREGVPRAGLDLSLVRGSVIHGRVMAGPGSKPVLGRPVGLREDRPALPPGAPPRRLTSAFLRIADTDEDGRYAFRVAPGVYRLYVPGPPDNRAEAVELTVADRDIQRNFHLPRDDRPRKTVRGVVRAKDAGGPPIPGAIMVLQTIELREPPIQGYADEQGRFDLFRMTGKVIVYARSPAGDFAGYAVIDGDDDRELDLVARPAATARGRVVDEDGKPWASIDVYCVVEAGLPSVGRDKPPGAGQSVTTDGDGRFTASGLPVGATCRFWTFGPGARDDPSHRIDIKDTRPLDVPPLIMPRRR
jgi:hypothetical protein